MLKNKFFPAILLAMTILLTACQAEKAEDPMLLEGAVQQAQEANFHTTTVTRGDYEIEARTGAATYYPVSAHLTWDRPDCRFDEILVGIGDEVKKGDTLITFLSEESTLQLESKEMELAELQETYAFEKERRERSIADAEKELWQYSSYAYVRAQKELELQKVSYEAYQFQQDHAIQELEKELEKMREEAERTSLTAPYDGVIDKVPYLESGDKVPVGETLIQMHDASKIALAAENPNGAFSYGQAVTITTRNEQYEGYIAAAGNVLPVGYPVGHMIICLTGDEAPAQSFGSGLSVGGAVITMKDVLIADKQAFSLDGGKYYVQILEDGAVHRRPVQIGSTNNNGNGKIVWILEGVDEGDTLILHN